MAENTTEIESYKARRNAHVALFGIIGSNIFALCIAGIYEALSLRGVTSIPASRVVLAFVWLVGVAGIVTSERVWGRGLRHRILWGSLSAVVLLGLLFGLDQWVYQDQSVSNVRSTFKDEAKLAPGPVKPKPKPNLPVRFLIKRSPLWNPGNWTADRQVVYPDSETSYLIFQLPPGRHRLSGTTEGVSCVIDVEVPLEGGEADLPLSCR